MATPDNSSVVIDAVINRVEAEAPIVIIEPPPPSLEEQIKAGDTSTTTIKAFIEEEAIRMGVDPKLATEIARAESGFQANAKNPKSSASGIFQYIDSTAKKYCVEKFGFMASLEEKNDPVKQTKCAVKMLSDGEEEHWEESRFLWGRFVTKE